MVYGKKQLNPSKKRELKDCKNKKVLVRVQKTLVLKGNQIIDDF